ncbi:MAG: arginase family protein [Actinomycetota bacterium]|nr:arginase family protein [Actinomycetota bacterium]
MALESERTARSRQPAVLDAPSNLGLSPPADGVVPGCYKLAGALRDCGFVRRLSAEDAGYVTPPRYDRGGWQPGDGVFNAAAIAAYSRTLADRIGALLDADRFPVVLGGDCSILLGAALAMNRRGRYGLAFMDGHSDFRHLGNSPRVGAAAGEDLALVTGRGQADLTDLEGRRPYVRDEDVAVLGIRDEDEALGELRALGVPVWEVTRLRVDGPAAAASAALRHLERGGIDGFWLHLDADILDPAVMPAVDSPDPGGLDHDELVTILAAVAASPRCVGLDVTVFDPDLDPDGGLAHDLTETLVTTLARALS